MFCCIWIFLFLITLVFFSFYTWFERASISVILANSITLSLVDYCDLTCESYRCQLLTIVEHIIFAYFTIEMLLKMIAMGVFGKGSYLSTGWNRFDCFIVVTGMAEYVFAEQDLNISAIRSLRILRPLRAITRISSLRLLVAWIFGSIPLLGNVLLFFMFIFLVFSIVSVQLWAGLLHQRCFFPLSLNESQPQYMPLFYQLPTKEFICSNAFGYMTCDKIPDFEKSTSMCLTMFPKGSEMFDGCKKWAEKYTECRAEGENPKDGTSFDNIGLASLTIFKVVSLQDWSEVMYLVQDTYSFWVWIFFVSIVLIVSYFAAKLCMVVVVAQFSVTLRQEEQRQAEEARRSSSRSLSKKSAEKRLGLYQRLTAKALQCLRCHKQKEDDQTEPESSANSCTSGFNSCRSWLRQKIDEPWSQILISCLIVANAAIMAMEHHDQSAIFTEVIETSNTVFTFVFLAELVIRYIAFGLEDFLREPFNSLDSVIIIMNIIDIASKYSKLPGVSVLRIFRMLRLVKILRFFPALQTQLLLMIHTMANATIFFLLLGFLLFISALLGTSLFSCRTCVDEQATSKCKLRILPIDATTMSPLLSSKLCPEPNFDGLFKSMFTVLRIFTRDAWVQIMNSTVKNTSQLASIYFVALITIGHYCIFNILVGILVQGFSVAREDELKRNLNYLPESKEKLEDSSSKEGKSEHPSKVKRSLMHCLDGFGSEKSFFLFSPGGSFRTKLKQMIATKYFDGFSLFVTMSTFVVIVYERPSMNPNSIESKLVDIANYIISGSFAVESLLKSIALGFILGKDTYLRNGWNILDFFLVILAFSDILVNLIFKQSPDSMVFKVFSVLRLFRTLRPLRIISRSNKLLTVIRSLALSFKPIGNIVIICGFFFAVFGILGVQIFKGCFASCVVPETYSNGTIIKTDSTILLASVKNREDCLKMGLQWERDINNFDNIKSALVTLFAVSMKVGWGRLTMNASRCLGPDMQPTGEIRFVGFVYFIGFVFVVCLFALNLFVGVVVNTFQKVQKKSSTTEVSKTNVKADGDVQSHDPEQFLQTYSSCRLQLYRFVSHSYFECAIMAVVFLNVIMIAIEHYGMNPLQQFLLDQFGVAFLAILFAEIFLKLAALGVVRYLQDKWNVLDLLITVSSLGGVILENVGSGSTAINPSAVRVARVFRIVRVVKLMKGAKTLQRILDTISRAVPQVLNLSVLFVLLFFIYGSVGVQMYGGFRCDPKDECLGLSRHSNFENFGMAVLTLFRIFTGDGWNNILKDLARMSTQDKFCTGSETTRGGVPCSITNAITPVYFISFVLLSQFILINIVVAVLMEQISELSKAQMNDLEPKSVEENEQTGKKSDVAEVFIASRPDFVNDNITKTYVSGQGHHSKVSSSHIEDLQYVHVDAISAL